MAREQLKTLTDSGEFEILVIGCLKECDFGINEGLRSLSNFWHKKNILTCQYFGYKRKTFIFVLCDF